MKEMFSRSIKMDELSSFVSELCSLFKPQQIILLEGDLGAGKTTLVNHIVQSMGVKESSSPTYSLINEYPLNEGVAYHVDLYRIEGDEDLESIGFWDLFEESRALIFIEWPQRMDARNLPLHWNRLKITIKKEEDDSLRTYEVFES